MSCCDGSENCSHQAPDEIVITGIPEDIPSGLAELCKARLRDAVQELMELSGSSRLQLSVGNSAPAAEVPKPRSSGGGDNNDEPTTEERAEQYKSK